MAANVVNLELPALAKLTLHAGCPLFGVGRVKLRRQHNELGLREELRKSWSRDLGLRERIGRDSARRPWTGEADRTGV